MMARSPRAQWFSTSNPSTTNGRPRSWRYSGTPNDKVFRQSEIHKPDEAAPSGISELEPFFTGPTAKDYKLEKPCYQ